MQAPIRSKINQWFEQQLDFEFPLVQKFAPTMRHDQGSIEERDAAVERLREFLRFNYMTGAQVAQRIGVRAEALYAWLQGKSSNGVSATSFRKWEERPEFPDLRARAQGLRIKALLAKLEAAAEAGNSAWKSYAWELEKIYRNQFGDQALTIFEQNNYQLSEEKARAIEARVQRLELEDSSTNREVSNGAE